MRHTSHCTRLCAERYLHLSVPVAIISTMTRLNHGLEHFMKKLLTAGFPLFVCILTVAYSAGTFAQSGGWMAGVAATDITPDEPVWMAGYASRTHAAEGVLLPLKAKALALQDQQGNRGLILTADVVGVSRETSDQIFSALQKALGLERKEMVFSSSHSHSGPVVGNSLRCIYPYDDEEARKLDRYTEAFIDKIINLGKQSFENIRPAILYSGNGIARFAVNRRNNQEGALSSFTALEGPQDHAVPVLKVSGEDGQLYAVLFGYACHATVLDGYLWSGDYPGFAQKALEDRYPGTTALFFAGCGADMNPLPRRQIPLVQQYGETLAAAVAAQLEGEMKRLDPVLKTGYSETTLDMLPPPEKEELEKQVATTSGYEQRCSLQLLESLEKNGSLPVSYPYPLQAWKLGGQGFAMLSGEPVVEYAIALKESLGQDLFVMGYANDYVSYIPSERIREEGGYEGCKSQIIFGLPNCWAPGLEEKILSGMRSLVESLH